MFEYVIGESFEEKGGEILEVKINREIREYTESMFFGLSLRQFIFSVLACGVAVGVYFLLRPVLGLETTSWLCTVVAVPFGAIGFLRYNGMPAEKVLLAIIRSELLMPNHVTFRSDNFYWHLREEAERDEKRPKRKRARRSEKSDGETKRLKRTRRTRRPRRRRDADD